jgi:hypothetical protein
MLIMLYWTFPPKYFISSGPYLLRAIPREPLVGLFLYLYPH